MKQEGLVLEQELGLEQEQVWAQVGLQAWLQVEGSHTFHTVFAQEYSHKNKWRTSTSTCSNKYKL